MPDELLSFYLYKQAMELKNVYRALFFIFLYSTCTAQTQGKYVINCMDIHIPRDISYCICISYVSQPLSTGCSLGIFCFPIAYGWLDYTDCEI